MGQRPSVLQPGLNCWRVEPADRVALLIDNDEAFDALKPLLLAARRSIWILAWVFDPLTRLDPDRVRKSRGPEHADRIGLILRRQAALNPALDVRVLTWDMPFPIAAAQLFGPQRGAAFFAGSRVKYQMDATLPASACHHQKMVIIDGATALLSGGDIGVDRWDTCEHLDNDPRRRLPTGQHYPARHEVAMLVDGPAARALGDVFRSRWQNATGEALALADPTPDAPWPEGLVPDLRRADIAIARTQAAWKGRPEIIECLMLHLAGIRAARRLIYLENQYLTSPLIVEALATRLAEPDGPEVVTIGPARSPSYFDRITMDSARTSAINRLHAADVHGRFTAFSAHTPAGGSIIVHSKVAIIDDSMLRIGSANLNNRSVGLDTECDLAFEGDTDLSRELIAAFLARLVGHFLGRAPLDVELALRQEGGLAAAITLLDGQGEMPRRLQPVPTRRLTGLQQFIADWNLGDSLSPEDAWRPWGRRARLRRDLLRLAAPPVPGHPQP
jgi:phosphatidylserine/phosphatidylglycerophosphate/cardiolipin synthase-like enzyme